MSHPDTSVVTSPRLDAADSSGLIPAVAGVAAVFFVHGMLFASWVAHIPQIRTHLGISIGLLGVALLGAPVGSILAMSGAGHLISHLGSRRVLRTGMIGYCLAGTLLGLAENLPAFFFAFMLWGMFQGTLEVAMNTQGVAVESTQQRSVMPMLHGSWSLGALAGAGIGTLAVAAGVSLTNQLLVLGVVSLAVLTIVTRGLLPLDRQQADLPADSDSRPQPGRSWVTVALLILCVIALADMLCEGAAADWSAVYLRSSLHDTGPLLGLAYTLYSLVMVTTRFAGSRLIAKRPRQQVLPALTTVATVGFAVGLAAHNTALTLIGFCCLGAGCALVIPTTYSSVGRTAGANAGKAVALVSGIGWLGFVAGPPLIGQLASATSLRTALIIIPALTALITALIIATGGSATAGHTDHGTDTAQRRTDNATRRS